MRRAVGLLGAVASVAVLGACSGGGSGSHPTSSAPGSVSVAATPSGAPTGLGGGGGEQTSAGPRSTVTTTVTPSASLKASAAPGQVVGTCPYLPSATFSQYEGDRIGFVTVSRTKPVDCTFYFWDNVSVIGAINVEKFATSTEAFNAMATSYGSQAKHPEVEQPAAPTIGDGAVLFKTDLAGEQTWQCVFAKGDYVYTVRTRQSDIALNAANIARAVAQNVH